LIAFSPESLDHGKQWGSAAAMRIAAIVAFKVLGARQKEGRLKRSPLF